MKRSIYPAVVCVETRALLYLEECLECPHFRGLEECEEEPGMLVNCGSPPREM